MLKNHYFEMILLATVVLAAHAYAGERPNVLIIYTDDQGSIDLNCYGATDLQTPNLDALASQGVRFTQMLAPAPICSASRVGLLTGRIPLRAGQPGNGPMPAQEITVGEVFSGAGYITGHVGKWHLGHDPENRPRGQGFASSFGHMEGCIDNFSHFFMWSGSNRHDLWRDGVEVFEDGKFFPDLMVRECNAFIDTSKDSEKPFMLYWAFNAPHYPYQGTERWREAYKDLESPRDKYAAFVSTADEYIGKVIDHLKETGEFENTIIVYQSDHGHSTESRAYGGGGNPGPYRGAKQSLFEGGLRVPSIVSWPGKIPANQSRAAMVTGCDWLPTLCELCEIKKPKTILDGKSIVDVIQSSDAPSPHETFHWQFGRGARAQWAVRSGSWKLIGNPVDTTLPQDKRVNGGRLKSPLFLANLADDPGESQNLASKHPDIVNKLRECREDLLKELSP